MSSAELCAVSRLLADRGSGGGGGKGEGRRGPDAVNSAVLRDARQAASGTAAVVSAWTGGGGDSWVRGTYAYSGVMVPSLSTAAGRFVAGSTTYGACGSMAVTISGVGSVTVRPYTFRGGTLSVDGSIALMREMSTPTSAEEEEEEEE